MDTVPVIYPVISLVFGLTGQNIHYITQFQGFFQHCTVIRMYTLPDIV